MGLRLADAWVSVGINYSGIDKQIGTVKKLLKSALLTKPNLIPVKLNLPMLEKDIAVARRMLRGLGVAPVGAAGSRAQRGAARTAVVPVGPTPSARAPYYLYQGSARQMFGRGAGVRQNLFRDQWIAAGGGRRFGGRTRATAPSGAWSGLMPAPAQPFVQPRGRYGPFPGPSLAQAPMSSDGWRRQKVMARQAWRRNSPYLQSLPGAGIANWFMDMPPAGGGGGRRGPGTGGSARFRRVLGMGNGPVGNAFRGAAGMMMIGGAMGAMYAPVSGVRSFMAYEDEMRFTESILRQQGASPAQIAAVREQAKNIARRTEFDPAQIAGAQGTLARRGVSAANILRTMPTVANFATAGRISLEEAVEASMSLMEQFSLPFEEFGSVADSIKKTADSTSSDVDTLRQALKMVGSLSDIGGMDYQTALAALGAMSQGGLKGTMAGRGLRAIVAEMIGPDFQKAMKTAGININMWDDQGKFDLIGTIRQYKQQIAEVPAGDRRRVMLESIFGGLERVGGNAFATLVNQGPDFIADLKSQQQNAKGVIDESAEYLRQTLSKAFERLGESWRTLWISVLEGDKSTGLRKFVDDLAQSINTFSESPTLASLVANLTALLGVIKDFGVGGKDAVLALVGAFGSLSDIINAINWLITGGGEGEFSLAKLLGGMAMMRYAGGMFAPTKAPFANIAKLAPLGAALTRLGPLTGIGWGVTELLKMFDIVPEAGDFDRGDARANALIASVAGSPDRGEAAIRARLATIGTKGLPGTRNKKWAEKNALESYLVDLELAKKHGLGPLATPEDKARAEAKAEAEAMPGGEDETAPSDVPGYRAERLKPFEDEIERLRGKEMDARTEAAAVGKRYTDALYSGRVRLGDPKERELYAAREDAIKKANAAEAERKAAENRRDAEIAEIDKRKKRIRRPEAVASLPTQLVRGLGGGIGGVIGEALIGAITGAGGLEELQKKTKQGMYAAGAAIRGVEEWWGSDENETLRYINKMQQEKPSLKALIEKDPGLGKKLAEDKDFAAWFSGNLKQKYSEEQLKKWKDSLSPEAKKALGIEDDKFQTDFTGVRDLWKRIQSNIEQKKQDQLNDIAKNTKDAAEQGAKAAAALEKIEDKLPGKAVFAEN